MKRAMTLLACLALCGIFFTATVYAEAMSNQELSDRIRQLEAKLGAEGGILPDKWNERITLSGTIEVEAGYVSTDPEGGDSTDESDISVATVELGVDAEIVKHVSGHILFLYEDGEDIVIDEATITLSGEDVIPAFLTVGEMYVPFGNFESHMISDPLTLEIAETREAAIQVGVESGGFYGSAFIFNGDVDEADEDDDHIDNFGANAGYTMESDTFTIDAGISYINNLIDADGWEDIIDEEGLELNDYAAGLGAYAIVGIGPVTLIGEYITALDEIEWVGEAPQDEISAWNLEVGYTFAIGEKEAVVAAALQGTDEAENAFPETRYMGSFSLGIFKATTLAFEYAHGEFENDDEEDAFTAQLAIEF
ncbi:LbtU family siderophore porin [Desulfosarcina ovata]|uniref:Porin domain-containing protein n=1 Tax=Desulfosarcina ovata subsp. ovata TaxID=2752305 RepID=A0A5K8AB43_9BACT|nr:LbtU family siderophore porin [Desulfosarcina ovata]BBO89751.1 hypothetical protein DSCOOX_29310 [Desulfosarcina ovata subsp. ovata]